MPKSIDVSSHQQSTPPLIKSAAQLRELAYAQIKQRIISCEFRPGDAINEAQLAALLGLGRTPIHQALHRLEVEGMVTIMPRKGVMVTALSLNDVLDMIEVRLSNEYQQGINWTVVRNGLPLLQVGPAGTAMPSGVPVSGVIPSMANLTPSYTRIGANSTMQLFVALRLLESFGNTKVLSSPKISALNNQAALLKVTEDLVYFTLSANYTPGSAGSAPTFTLTSTPNTVSVGLVMNVMPQVGEGDEVTLILRPTLSRVVSYVDDPAVPIYLAQARNDGINVSEISSRIPQIQTREMESVIKVRSGDTAVLGGLMRDDVSGTTDQTPGIGSVPGLGELFKYKKKASSKSELVIFLRPTVVSSASLTGDHQPFEPHLSEALRPMPERMKPAPVEPEPLPGGRP